jgi:hypothetical protein
MSTYDPNNRPRSGDAGGSWIIGIIVVVLIGLGVWWWAGTTGSGPTTASTGTPPAATTGAAPSSANPSPPPAPPAGTAR